MGQLRSLREFRASVVQIIAQKRKEAPRVPGPIV